MHHLSIHELHMLGNGLGKGFTGYLTQCQIFQQDGMAFIFLRGGAQTETLTQGGRVQNVVHESSFYLMSVC